MNDMHRVRCGDCCLHPVCLPMGLSDQHMQTVSSLIDRSIMVERGEVLCRAGDEFTALYAVQSGAFKCTQLSSDGSEKLLAFHLPGELFGFDAISDQRYITTVKALETSTVCKIPFEQLLKVASELPILQKQMFCMMSGQMTREQFSSRQATAMQSLVGFLANLSSRYKRRGCSSTQFNLPMSREDVGNYLGLASETVSRLLTQLEKQQVISVRRRHITLLDQPQLQSLMA
ncbi:MAG: cyclic nucleotide-binding domain-containing protein [Coxiellaceae bacterium]|nr:cyclic nucleotide-binding domain-containing protein [Coxiellaceae bacterium]